MYERTELADVLDALRDGPPGELPARPRHPHRHDRYAPPGMGRARGGENGIGHEGG
ncbi:hypothetical protein [Pseudonocardia humida]|uniref:Uncharacterized protein n=1 Tax=Pseudonocardia humida TaxID=2800819 RepID=A0ABT0ZSF5_9PSEU|nr:hypothetical protein [Pseudonocardia humida]MCO1653630.1 hypothetical protein [Pseudonocardia humida]